MPPTVMTLAHFTELLDAGEGLRIEFKRRFSSPEKIAREMIAFANTAGGIMMFGVDDDRTVVGVESEKGEMELIAQAAEAYADPPVAHTVSVFSTRGRDVVCVDVPESRHKPHYLVQPGSDERTPYVRVGESSVQASREMEKILRHRSGDTGPVRLIIGDAEKRLIAWLEAQHRITVKEYAQLINVSERRASRLLIRLVRAGAIAIHTQEKSDYFTLMKDPR
jgi:predicted HTH transcriptional regulator